MKFLSAIKFLTGKFFVPFTFRFLLVTIITIAMWQSDVIGNAYLKSKDMLTNLKSEISKMARANNLKWLCYYGDDRAVLSLPHYNLLVLEADALGSITRQDKGNRICLAYMSIGEVAPTRWFWPLVENKPWVLEKNRDWDGSARVNPASKEWQEMLINLIAPKLLEAGYDGFMLDNVDIGEYLEQMDPKKYAGAKNAVVDIIRLLRKTYPHAAIVPNGGLDTAAEAADCIDAVVRESIFSRWILNSSGAISYVNVSQQARAWLWPRLMRIRGLGIPILDLEYVKPGDASARKRVLEESRNAGFFPYIAQRNLMHLPVPADSHSVK